MEIIFDFIPDFNLQILINNLDSELVETLNRSFHQAYWRKRYLKKSNYIYELIKSNQIDLINFVRLMNRKTKIVERKSSFMEFKCEYNRVIPYASGYYYRNTRLGNNFFLLKQKGKYRGRRL